MISPAHLIPCGDSDSDSDHHSRTEYSISNGGHHQFIALQSRETTSAPVRPERKLSPLELLEVSKPMQLKIINAGLTLYF